MPRRMVDLIESKVTWLARHPDIGPVGRMRGTRERVVHEGYLVIYRVGWRRLRYCGPNMQARL